MVGQENDFLDNIDFGVQSTELFDDDSSLLFGSGESVSAQPETLKSVEEQQEEEETKIEKEEETPSISLDDILGSEDIKNEKEEVDSDKKDLEDKEKPEEETSVFSTLTQHLTELGIFSEDSENTIETAEEFRDRWVQEKQKQVNETLYNFLIDKHGEEGYELFQALFVHGVDPKSYLEKYSTVNSFKDLDLDDEKNQEKVYRTYLQKLGLSEKTIEKKLERSKDFDTLSEEAKEFHEKLIEDELKQLEAEKEAVKEREFQKQQEDTLYLNNLNKILSDKLKDREFDGIPVTEKVAKDTINYMFVKKWKLPSGELLTDFDKDILELKKPENHERKVKLALLLRSNLDLTKVKEKAVSKTSNKLFNGLVIKEKTENRKKTTPSSNTSSIFDGLL